jgi:hypothetical protein
MKISTCIILDAVLMDYINSESFGSQLDDALTIK